MQKHHDNAKMPWQCKFKRQNVKKCIKILAKCDTRTEYVYCCHFTITCFGLSCEKYINQLLKHNNFDAVHTQSCAIKQDIISLIETDSLIYT
jgi:deoxyhypusine synthase